MDNINEALIKYLITSEAKNPADLSLAKRKFSKKYKIFCPTNMIILKTYHKLVKSKKLEKSAILETLLRTRPIRSLSGIVNISVLTKYYPCPGKCIYCPSEKGLPKSYVSGEPAVERAKALKFSPYLQTKKRIEMLEIQGHPTDKIELRIVGGTWSYYPKKYQDWFIKRCFDACNGRGRNNPRSDLRKSQKINETANHRIVGLSVETRPDFINPAEIEWLRELGVTMVELGVQSIYDDVLKLNKRNHEAKKTILATRLLKDAGFKVLYQMMPNLLGSNSKRDLEMFKELFSNANFQPDLLKIYPCALLEKTQLYKFWKNKKYKPYTEKQLVNLLTLIKKDIPYYARIQRIARDIPSELIVSGPAQISNIRQLLKNKKIFCKCIRCREVREDYDSKEKLFLFRQNYNASKGKEIFLSFENPIGKPSASYGASKTRKLYSLLRLRITSTGKAIIRELHTFGQQLAVSDIGESPQHKGLGKKLIIEAEKIARQSGAKVISVISAVGVRGYYKKLGYKLKDTYMIKKLGN